MRDSTEQGRLDTAFMRRAIELADEAGRTGDLPFGAVVVRGSDILGEGSNILQQKNEIDGHAERIALCRAQARAGSRTLPGCTVYSTVEPCPMCSFPIRELHIARVVFGLRSPVMGGYTRFGVLQDTGLSDKVAGFFGPPPAITEHFLKEECEESWKIYVPEAWSSLSARGVLC